MAMSDAERARLIAEIESQTPEQRLARSKPLTPKQRAACNRVKKKMGRPVVGKGAKMVMVSIERELLHDADKFARAKGMKRFELVSAGLRLALARSA